MRLGQLARKLATSPAEIAQFLATKSIQIDGGANSKIEEDHLNLIIQHFAPGMAEFTKETPEISEPVVVNEIISGEPVAEVPVEPVVEDIVVNEPLDIPQEIELIKAPKVELPGLKVLGKIDLPEPKKKEALPEGDVSEGTEKTEEKREVVRRQPVQRRENREQRPRRSSLEPTREQQAIAEEKRRLQAEEQKARRTQNYLKKVKSVPTKSIRRYEEELVEETEEIREVPKTWWGKFKRWLTT